MSSIIEIIFTGVCNGIGTATGSYLAVRYAIVHIPKIEDRTKKIKDHTKKIKKLLFGEKNE